MFKLKNANWSCICRDQCVSADCGAGPMIWSGYLRKMCLQMLWSCWHQIISRHKIVSWKILFYLHLTQVFTSFSIFSEQAIFFKMATDFVRFNSMSWVDSFNTLTHWGRVTNICVSNLTNIGSDNGLSPGRRQAIIWTNARILFIGPLGTNFNEILIEILTFSFKKMRLKVSSGKWRPFCLGLNVLRLGNGCMH